jgi:hypothetical protein
LYNDWILFIRGLWVMFEWWWECLFVIM